MTDFFQILQRETVQKKEESTAKDGSDIKVEKTESLILEKNNKRSIKDLPQKTIKKEIVKARKKTGPKPKETLSTSDEKILSHEAINPIWLTLSEAAKLGGIQKKTIKRAINSKLLTYRIVDNRYQVELRSTILFLRSRKKLWNKTREHGIGQYVEKWIG